MKRHANTQQEFCTKVEFNPRFQFNSRMKTTAEKHKCLAQRRDKEMHLLHCPSFPFYQVFKSALQVKNKQRPVDKQRQFATWTRDFFLKNPSNMEVICSSILFFSSCHPVFDFMLIHIVEPGFCAQERKSGVLLRTSVCFSSADRLFHIGLENVISEHDYVSITKQRSLLGLTSGED